MGWFGSRERSAADAATWQAWAAQHAVTLEGTFPAISFRADLHGVTVGLLPVCTAGDAEVSSYQVWIPLPIDTHDLWIARHHLFDSLARSTTDAVRTLGDRVFDRAFLVISDDADLAERTLGPAQRAALLAARDRLADVRLSGSAVRTSLPRDEASPEELMRAVAALTPLARAFARAG